MSKCLIHYFSGTGNTYHMVKTMEQELKSKGYEVDVLNIEEDKCSKLKDYELHIFCFPIYGFGTPSIMLRYASSLSKVKAKAAIVCNSAGFEGQGVSHFEYLLKKKGFEVFFTDMGIYTYNWTQFINPQSKEVEKKVFKEAEVKVKEVIQKIVNHENNFLKRNIITIAISWIFFIGFSKLGRKLLGRSFIADSSCINCGKCKKVCPVQAIEMKNGKPSWNFNCESCQRCINMCPTKSIQLSIVKLLIFMVSELAPVFILIYINKNIIHFLIMLNIGLYFIMFAINTFLANILITIMEKVKIVRKIFEISYTKKYRRNVAEGFKFRMK